MRFKPTSCNARAAERRRGGFTLAEVLAALLLMAIVIPVAVWHLMEEGTYGTMCAMALVETGIIFLGVIIFKLFVKGEIVNQA